MYLRNHRIIHPAGGGDRRIVAAAVRTMSLYDSAMSVDEEA